MRLLSTTTHKKLIALATLLVLAAGYVAPTVGASSALKNIGKGVKGAADDVAPAVPVKPKSKAAVNAPKAPGAPPKNTGPGGIYQGFPAAPSSKPPVPKPPLNVVKKPAAAPPAAKNLLQNPNPKLGFPSKLPPVNVVKKPAAAPPAAKKLLQNPNPKPSFPSNLPPVLGVKKPLTKPPALAKQKPWVPGAALRQAPDAPRVYDTSLAGDLRLDRTAKVFKGATDVDKRGLAFLKGNSSIGNNLKLGPQFTKGGVSRVYALKGDPSKVVKIVGLERFRRQVLDQEVGRKMLSDVKAKSPVSDVFSVVKQDRFEVAEAAGPPRRRFAVSVEENISQQVRNPKTGEVKSVTNAMERLAARGDKSLTPKEELTVNLAIRELNKNGIAWTDHKLQNFDIVPDPKSRTGHRMVFFDFDGFRPVKGKTRTERFKTARRSQRAYDSHLDNQDDLAKRLGIDLKEPRFSKVSPQVRRTNLARAISEKNGFDYRVFGDQKMGTLSTPGVNKAQQRNLLEDFNKLDDKQFARSLQIMTNSQNSSRIAATAAATAATVGGVGVIAGTVYVLSNQDRTSDAENVLVNAKDTVIDTSKNTAEDISDSVVDVLSPDDGVPIVEGVSSRASTTGFVSNPTNSSGGN